MEILLAVSIMAIFSFFAVGGASSAAKKTKARASFEIQETIRQAIYNFQKDHNRYPESLTELTKPDPVPYLQKIPKDPLTGDFDWQVYKIDAEKLVYFPFDENEGTFPPDRSGNSHYPARLTSGAAWTSTSRLGYAISLDGANDYIYLDKTTNPNTNTSPVFDSPFTARTAIVWYRANTVAGTRFLYEEGDSNNGMNLYINAGLLYAGAFRSGGGGFTTFISTPTTAAAWHMAACTFDSASNLFRLYHDGVLSASGAAPNSIAQHNGNDAVGARINDSRIHTGASAGNGNYFQGIIDEVRFYERALTADEINRIYRLPKRALEGWYDRFPEKQYDQISDIRSSAKGYQNL